MEQKRFSVINVLVGLLIALGVMAVFISWPDRRARRIASRVVVIANLHALVAVANLYMSEYDVNSVKYEDIVEANLIEPNALALAGRYADFSGFKVNDTDRRVEVVTKDGVTVSYEFEPLKK